MFNEHSIRRVTYRASTVPAVMCKYPGILCPAGWRTWYIGNLYIESVRGSHPHSMADARHSICACEESAKGSIYSISSNRLSLLLCIQWWFVNPGSDSPEISLIRTKSAGTDFLFWTDGRFSNPENSLIRKYRPGTNVSGLTNHHCTVNVEIFAWGNFRFFALSSSSRKLPPRENKTHMPLRRK